MPLSSKSAWCLNTPMGLGLLGAVGIGHFFNGNAGGGVVVARGGHQCGLHIGHECLLGGGTELFAMKFDGDVAHGEWWFAAVVGTHEIADVTCAP
jgi:hypothetical protein